MNKDCDVDPFDLDISKYMQHEKKEQEELRKTLDIGYKYKNPCVKYNDGDIYYKSDDGSTDDDEPLIPQNKSNLNKRERIEKVKKLIPTLRNKKEKKNDK